MRIIFVTIALLFFGFLAKAQDPHFSQFFSSPLTLNPAFTGKFDGIWRLAANHRDQWPSIPKAYVTTSGSFDMPIMTKKVPEGDVFGLGFSGLSDASGNSALKLNYGSVSLSYHKSLDDAGYNTIGLGFQGTYASVTIDPTKLVFEDQLRQNGFTGTTADVLTNGNNQNYFDVNAGLLFSGSTNGYNNYYIGASIYHLNRPTLNFKNDNNWYLTNRVTIHAGGSFPVSDALTVHASAIQQIQNKASETVLGVAMGFNVGKTETNNPSSLFLGSWMRFNDALIPYVGLEVGGFRFGASYDVNISNLKAATISRGGTEFSIIYIKQPPNPTGIPCPKF